MESKKAMKDQADDDFEDSGFETKTPPPPERLIVQDEDMEHLAYDCVIGQLWHTWKRALRGSLSLMTYPGLRSTRPRVAHRQADDSRVYERSFMSNMDLSHVHDAPGPISHSEPDLPQTECVRDPTCKDIVRSRSKTLQDQKTPDAQGETDEAMERISQHYRSQSMTTSPAAKRRAMLLSSQARVKRPSPDDVDPVYVPSALDTVDIDRHLEEQSRSNKDRSASPDLSYYFEASANRRADRGEVNEEPMLTSCFTMQDPQESQEKQHTLPWLIPPEYKEGDKSSTSDCMSIKTRPPATAFSTTYSLHRANSRADSASGKILPSITSGFSSTKRPFTEESNQSPVSSMFRHLIPRNITSEGSDKSRVEVQSISSAPGLDDLLSRDGTIRMTYQSGRMRDIESRRTVERSRLPASAAREPSVRSDNSTRLLSEFIRSTGPEQLPEPRGASPRNRKGPQFQARDAGYDKEEDLHELAEFIRRGPPESHKKYGHKTVPMSIRVPQNYGTAPLEPYLSSSAGDSQASSMATPHSETDDTSAPSTPEKLAVDPFNDADLNNITLSEFLRTMPVPSEAQCGPSLLPAARRFQGFDGKPPSVRTMSTIQNRSCTTRSIKTVSMKPSVASLGRKSTFSSPSAPSSEYISMKDADTALRKTKQMLRKHKKTSADPYRDSPYGERDTPYGASLERERRTRKFANILRSRTDSTSPPIPSALSDGGPSGESRLSARDRSMSAADSSKHSMMSGSYGGNTSSVKVMISGPDDAMKARYKGSGGHVNDSFSSAGSRKQPRTITKLFKKAR
ncbi:hypothetical protein AAP_02243 [Ascosphaera apis ARSEF 7405]|uniref:Uncharacterized protein n=1 Tax=Ascosphaera apis ARSEF 7405 TaxID=392613 RepID=A0A168A4A7_9EURO|nr:hypothetical protein AAP_02243 [Ascosphaera apis ARSEF 7405]